MIDVGDVTPYREAFPLFGDSQSMLGMTIHMEREYAKRFVQGEGQQNPKGEEGGVNGDGDASGGVPSSRSPLPPKEDVSWGHILAHNQV